MKTHLTARPAQPLAWSAERPTDPDAWKLDGLCRQGAPDAWFPTKGGTAKPIKAICADCPVRAACLEYALVNGERWGIWGGLSRREREKLRAPVRRSRAPRSHPKRVAYDPVRVDCPCSRETCGGRVSEKTRRRHLAADQRRDTERRAA